MSMLPDLLENYQPFDEEEAVMVKQLRQFLAHAGNAYARDNLTAHVVGDAWIVDPARRKVVLVEHAANKSWMAPGGHCDGNPDVLAGAAREAEEEAGLTSLTPLLGGRIYDINSGFVPLRRNAHGLEPAHVHFDVCFAFEAPENAPLKISHESTNLRWFGIDELDALDFWPAHRRRIAKMRAGYLDR